MHLYKDYFIFLFYKYTQPIFKSFKQRITQCIFHWDAKRVAVIKDFITKICAPTLELRPLLVLQKLQINFTQNENYAFIW